jgi:hypothetical protein
MNAPTRPNFLLLSSSRQASSTSSTFSIAMPSKPSGYGLQKSVIQSRCRHGRLRSRALSGTRYQNRPWLGCKQEPHAPSSSFFRYHCVGIVGAFADVFPDAEKIDL